MGRALEEEPRPGTRAANFMLLFLESSSLELFPQGERHILPGKYN